MNEIQPILTNAITSGITVTALLQEIFMTMKNLKAVKSGGQTIVAGNNCFDVVADNGASYRIINFFIEPLKELVKQGMVSWPIDIKEVHYKDKRGIAVIDDIRIPDKYYQKEYCEVCCPYNYLTQPQKDSRDRENRRKSMAVYPAIHDTMPKNILAFDPDNK
jgi:hypothetical protein